MAGTVYEKNPGGIGGEMPGGLVGSRPSHNLMNIKHACVHPLSKGQPHTWL